MDEVQKLSNSEDHQYWLANQKMLQEVVLKVQGLYTCLWPQIMLQAYLANVMK
jgi:hypothetical protein